MENGKIVFSGQIVFLSTGAGLADGLLCKGSTSDAISTITVYLE